jgi:PAS domain-containing protein
VSELGHFDVIYQAIRNQEGAIEDVLSFTVDVSDSVRARSAVAEARDSAEHARERLRAILTAIPTATAVLQGDALAFELVDPAYQALVPKLQVVGQPLRDVFPNSVSDHEAVVRAVMRDGAPIHRPEVREVYDRTGTGEPYEGYFNASIAPLKSPDGAIEAVVASIVEVTEQVAQRERLAAVSRELEQAHAQLEQRIAERTEQLAQANRALLYRVVQEAMTNIARHAHAQRVSVVLERHDGHAIVGIEDDGVGFDASVPAVGRLGLIGMHERVLLAGGTLDVESEPTRTLETYKHRGMTKLGLANRADVVRLALQRGWING